MLDVADLLPDDSSGSLELVDITKIALKEISAAPDQASPQMFAKDPLYLHVERIEGGIGFLVVVLPTLVVTVVLWLTAASTTALLICAAIAGILLVFVVVAGFIWPPIAFRHYRWRLDDQQLEIHRGVWWKHRTSIPRGRVQHADVTQGPLLRRYDLGNLVVHTAGTSHATVQLEGLSHATAMELRDRLVVQSQGRRPT